MASGGLLQFIDASWLEDASLWSLLLCSHGIFSKCICIQNFPFYKIIISLTGLGAHTGV
jgi:hypothetical protein